MANPLPAIADGYAITRMAAVHHTPGKKRISPSVASLLRDSPDSPKSHALAKELKRAVRAKHEANKEHLSTVADLNRQLERIKNIAKEYESSKEVASVISTQLERSNVNANAGNVAFGEPHSPCTHSTPAHDTQHLILGGSALLANSLSDTRCRPHESKGCQNSIQHAHTGSPTRRCEQGY